MDSQSSMSRADLGAGVDGMPDQPTGVSLPPGRWAVEADRSTVGFRVKKMGMYYVKGRFRQFRGTVEMRADGRLTGEVQVAADSIFTRIPPRDAHLRSAQFLAAKSNPEIRFRTEDVEATPDDAPRISGTMEIRGVSAPVALQAEAHGAAGAAGPVRLHLRGRLDRHAFGIRPPQPFEMVVGADVHLEIDLLLDRL